MPPILQWPRTRRACWARGDRARIRICANPACRAYFHDRSQAGRRRWCDMTRCGNVAKVQRYRQRHLRLVEPE